MTAPQGQGLREEIEAVLGRHLAGSSRDAALRAVLAVLERRGDDDAARPCCPYCGCDFPVDGDGLMVEHIHPRKPDAVCPGTGRRCHREATGGDDDAARVRRDALELIDRDGCEKVTGNGRCWDVGKERGAKYGADAWCSPCIARRALDGDDTGSGQ